ncbi:PBSX family phage terminase large subunit [Leuconostoc mesenteroides]|uniref:PBSX family phage terminase large subunit n=1 Tax=Leuconostoc mesenteroides TaxID=1245 RepID=UPI001CBC69F5|nr:PBSX family phage terminase large subunit [Leuconostoc mesenteroides]MBZ1518153.1 PBSX family phage terminase large subunit [Leuconostoc mesenteroides]MBZ1521064.1 PBSX family phage terminase large subunit [Leuconostoc mesenteroides]MBZ1522950.1 PBSX family phage terminase large subunit [Leuconostoc mesenteroides]
MSTIDWNLPKMVSEAYAPLFNTKHRYIVYKGSRGSGKSEAEATKVIYDIITKPYVNWLVLRRYANTNRQSTFTLLQKVANRMGVGNLFQFNSSLPEITYKPTGQKILFRGADKPLSITSISVETGNLCRLWVEEAYQLESEEAFDTVDESMRGIINDSNGFYQTVLTFNPWNERHWLKKRFFDKDTRVTNSLALTTTYKDNPFLDEDYVNRLLEMKERNPRRARVAVDGEWGVAEGLIYENTIVENFDIREVLKGARIVRGMDWGYGPDPTTFIEYAINVRTKDVYIFKEMYKQHMLTDEIFKWLYVNGYQQGDIRADYANGGDRMIQELKNKGIKGMKRAHKYEIMFGVTYLQDYKIHVLPSLEHTIEELNSYVYDTDKEGGWVGKAVDKNNHLMDAMRYAVEPLIMTKKSTTDRMEAFKQLGLGR